MFVFDTNVASELRRRKPHGAVLEWLNHVPREQIYLSAVTLGELQTGVERTRERDRAKAVEIDEWIDALAKAFNVLPMDEQAFRLWARLMHGKSDHLMEDAMIAATAIVHGMTVVTRNVADFEPFGVPTVNPFLDRRRGA